MLRRLLSCLALLGGLFVSPSLLAATCDIYGGTSVRGCEYPLAIRYVHAGKAFADIHSAAEYFAYRSNTLSGKSCYPNRCNKGVMESAYQPQSGVQCLGDNAGCLGHTWTDYQVVAPGSTLYTSGSVPSTILQAWGRYLDANGNPIDQLDRSYASVQAVCRDGYSPVYEGSSFVYPPHFGFACRPRNNPGTIDLTGSQCEDLVRNGCVNSGMPVELGTRLKKDYVVDYQNHSPFPIRWGRHYSSSLGMWSFEHLKRLTYGVDGTWAYMVVRRADGGLVRFSATVGTWSWWATLSDIKTTAWSTQNANGDPEFFYLKTWNGTIEEYEVSTGRLLRQENAQGLGLAYLYDTQGRMIRIEDDSGRYLNVTYYATEPSVEFTTSWLQSGGTYSDPTTYSGRSAGAELAMQDRMVSSVTDGTTTISYEWDLVGYTTKPTGMEDWVARLLSVSRDGDPVHTYHYGETFGDTCSRSPYILTGTSDGEGRRLTSYQYVCGVADKVKKEWRGPSTSPVEVLEFPSTSPIGVLDVGTGQFVRIKGYDTTTGQSTGLYSPCTFCQGASFLSIGYDSDNNITSLRDFNNVLEARTYADTDRGLLATRTEASGTSQARTTTWTWHPSFSVPLTQTEPVVSNGTGATRTTTWTYRFDGVPLTKTVSLSSGGSRQWAYTHTTQGLLETVTHPSGRVDHYGYDGQLNLVSFTQGYGTAAALTTTLGGYTHLGKPGWVVAPGGSATRLIWDGRGRLAKLETGTPGSQGPGGAGGTWRATTMVYDDANLLASRTLPYGAREVFSYDSAARLTQIQRLDANQVLVSTTTYTLNAVSKPTRVEVADALGTVVLREDYGYDGYRRLVEAIGSSGLPETIAYDLEGNITGAGDALGHGVSQTFDALNRAISQTNAMTGVSTFTYGPQDEALTATDARGVATTYAYNGFGQITGLVSPDRGTWAVTYDAAGRKSTQTDPRGVVTTISYDDLERPTSIVFDTTGLTPAAGLVLGSVAYGFSYDTCLGGAGKLCATTDPTGTTAYSYNAWGEVVGQAWTGASGTPGAGITLSTGYAFDATTGRMTTVTLPSGKVLAVGYGSDGQISSLAYDGQGVVANVDWTAFGAIAGWTWPMASGWSGTHASVAFGYDLDGRPVEISDLDERDLAWDAGNRLLGVDDPNDAARAQAYGYDSLDRLTDADVGAWSEGLAYGYDAVGNRTGLRGQTSQDGMDYSYGTSHNRLVSRTFVVAGVAGSSSSLSYDAMGNLIDDGQGLDLNYDATGRLVEASKGVSVVHSGYSAQGQRVTRQVVGGSTAGITLFAYDTQGRPLGAYVPDSGAPGGFRVLEEYVHLDGWRVVAVVRPDATTGMANPRFFPVLSDHLGTPRKVLDGQTGETRWAWDAKEPFGFELPNEVPTSGLAAFSFDLRFPGQRADPETGLFQNGFRDYHPGLGRYVESDPLGLEAGWNTYAYVGSNPISFLDQFGLQRSGAPRFNRNQPTAPPYPIRFYSVKKPPVYYGDGLRPNEIANSENLSMLLTQAGLGDYTQYCRVANCPQKQNQCSSGDVRANFIPSDPTVGQVQSWGCSCLQPYYGGFRPVQEPVAGPLDFMQFILEVFHGR